MINVGTMYLARFTDGPATKSYWASQYQPLLQLPPWWIERIYRQSAVHVAALAALPPRGLMLDAGCGMGILAFLDRGQRRQRRLVGIDSSPELIAQTRRLSPGEPFAVASLDSLPFTGSSFDAYVAVSSLEFSVAGLLPPLREAFRVVRPGGRLMAACVRLPLDAHFRRNPMVRNTSGAFRMEHVRGPVPEFTPDAYGYYYGIREMARAARDAGFRRVRTRRCDLVGGFYYSRFASETARARITSWLARECLVQDEGLPFVRRFFREALLRETGLGGGVVKPVTSGLRSLCSFWNIVEAERP